MISRFVNIVFGSMLCLVTLTMLATPRTMVYGPWEPADCGMFNCDAQVDSTEVEDRIVDPACNKWSLTTGPFPIPNEIMELCFKGVDY